MKWEYLIEELTPECAMGIGIQKPVKVSAQVQKRLNELGAQGWELVGTGPPLPGACNPPPLGTFYFRRPKA